MNLTAIQITYRLLPVGKAVQFREECMASIGWSKSTFYNKMRGTYALTPLEERDVMRILSKYEKFNPLNSQNNDKT